MWTDGSPGLQRRSMSANQEHFLSAERQRANSSMSWKQEVVGGSQHNPFSLWVLRSEVKELVMSEILRACLSTVFSFMFPLVILEAIQSTEATLQLCLRHPSAKSHCSGYNHFAQPCGQICSDHELVHCASASQCTHSRRAEGGGTGIDGSFSFSRSKEVTVPLVSIHH